MFFEGFIILTLLVVIILFLILVFVFSLIIKKIVNKMQRDKYERETSAVIDAVIYYQENKNIKRVDELLKYIDIPKNMKISEENSEIIIYYKHLVYNINRGRYIEQNQ